MDIVERTAEALANIVSRADKASPPYTTHQRCGGVIIALSPIIFKY